MDLYARLSLIRTQISQITLEYTGCENAGANFTATTEGTFTDLPNFFYQLKSGDDKLSFTKPQWSFLSDPENTDHSKRMQCRLKFELPANFQHPVFVYYKLTNYYQNHRRYVQSLNADQLKGKAVSVSALSTSSCKPLAVSADNKPIYPCGLIANSVFNGKWCRGRLSVNWPYMEHIADEYKPGTNNELYAVPGVWRIGEQVSRSNPGTVYKHYKPTLLRTEPMILTHSADTIRNPVNTADNTTYTFSEKGIAWPGEKKKYSATTEYKLSEIVPPPNWALRYPSNYTESNFPDLTQDEHFQNWMRTAGLPTFSKLYGRNDNDDLKAGTYTLDVYLSAYHCYTQALTH